MVASTKGFYRSLYEEHLQECSALIEQIEQYRHDPSLTWRDVEDWEQRLDAHLVALTAGGDLALEVCRRRYREGDEGEMDAALRVFCRTDRKDLVYGALRDMPADAAAIHARALKAEWPAPWGDDLAAIATRHPRLIAVLAPVLGRRRVPVEPALLRVAESAGTDALTEVLRALGRTGTEAAVTAIEPHARSDEPRVAAAACEAALRLGDARVLGYALMAAPGRPWLATALGLGGDKGAVAVLEDIARSTRCTDDVLTALGLLGDLTAVRALHDCLANAERASAAAAALMLITGAELYEEVFVPDEIDPEELFDEERERYEHTGELPTRADGQPYGTTEFRPVVDQAAWRQWLSRNKSRFDPEQRYRLGEPYAPRSLARALLAERMPNSLRALICTELRVRFAVDFPMEIDMAVSEQGRLLARMEEWVRLNESRFAPGKWYLHGRLMATAN